MPTENKNKTKRNGMKRSTKCVFSILHTYSHGKRHRITTVSTFHSFILKTIVEKKIAFERMKKIKWKKKIQNLYSQSTHYTIKTKWQIMWKTATTTTTIVTAGSIYRAHEIRIHYFFFYLNSLFSISHAKWMCADNKKLSISFDFG